MDDKDAPITKRNAGGGSPSVLDAFGISGHWGRARLRRDGRSRLFAGVQFLFKEAFERVEVDCFELAKALHPDRGVS